MRILLRYIIIFLLVTEFLPVYGQGTRIDFNTIPKSGTILVYSHLDDDLIWMLPFWKITEKFVGGAMPATSSYRTIISQQQSYINNNGYNIDYQSNWYAPWDDISDTEYSQYYLNANTSYSYLVNDHLETRLFNDPTPLSRTEINKIKAKLEQFFADPWMKRVISHNNWGEYGHQHHKGINKAVRELAVKYRKDVWMLGCDNGGFIDVTVPNGITWSYGSFNMPDLYTGIRSIYVNNGRWTWYTDRIPSGDHKFIKIVDGGSDKSYILKGDEITYSGPSQAEPGAFIFDGSDDYLTLKGNNNSSFTIALKVRPDLIREMDIAAMSEYPGSSKNDRNFSMTSDGHIMTRIYDGTSRTLISNTAISAGSWSQLVITSNGSSLKLYINGSLDKTVTAGKAITNYSTPEFILGQAIQTDTYFKGQVTNVRFFNYVLSDSEIAQLSGQSYTITSSAGSGGTITPSGSVSANAGADVTFTVKANSGYEISDVSVDNSSVGTVSSYKFSNISSNHRITASFRRLSYSITTTAGSGGLITPGGTISVTYGSNQKFTIKGDIGYKISDVRVDNVSVGTPTEYTFSNVTSSHTLMATFTTATYVITSTAGQGGTISPSGTTVNKYGSDMTFTIIPDKGYEIKDLAVDNKSVGSVSRYTFTKITSDHSIAAMFVPITYTIRSLSGIGGSLNPSGNVKVNYGKDIHFSVIPEDGFKVSSILLDYLPVPLNSDDLTISNVTHDHVLSVAFAELQTFRILSGAGINGSISPSGEIQLTEGMSQTYQITPNPGYRILNVFIDTIPVGPVSEYTVRNISGDHTVSASFTTAVKADVYPNPFRSGFSLVIRSPFDYTYDVYIATMNHGIVFSETGVTANTEVVMTPVLPAGLYILNVYHNGKKVALTRVVKY